MKPTHPNQIYKKTAKRLNLPEEYVKDLIEFFYQQNKDGMGNLEFLNFNLVGLGNFLIRPLKFFRKQNKMLELVEKFVDRRDDRGLMIRRNLELRYSQFLATRPKVDNYNKEKLKKMYKTNEKALESLEEQK